MIEDTVDLPRLAVGIVLLYRQQVALVRRAGPPLAGHWALPGGKLEPGETLAEAAVREAQEELGLVVEALAPVHVLELMEPTGPLAVGQSRRFHYVIVDMQVRYVAGRLKAGGDAAEAAWFDRDALLATDVDTHSRDFLLQWWSA